MNIQEILQGVQAQIRNQFADDDLPDGIDSRGFVTAAGESIISEFTRRAQSGDLSGIQEMFSGSETSAESPVLSGISPDIVNSITSKFGINPDTASSLVSKFLPTVLNTFNEKSNQSGFDVQSIVAQFIGGGGVADVISQFSGGENKENPASPKGGIFSLIKGLFGR